MSEQRRSIREIALEISEKWPKVHYAADPYMQAMRQIRSGQTMYGHDSVADIILRFIGNATTFRGADARRLKEELRTHLPPHGT